MSQPLYLSYCRVLNLDLLAFYRHDLIIFLKFRLIKNQRRKNANRGILLKKITFSESLLFGLYEKILCYGNILAESKYLSTIKTKASTSNLRH